tara:strand:- start:15570 stop:15857 length:288 start_codon:yes stop_codon:yes gene_type:complete
MSEEIKLTPTQQEAYALLQKFGSFVYSRQAQAFTSAGCLSKIQTNTAKLLKKKKIVKGNWSTTENNRKILSRITLREDNPVQKLVNEGKIQLPIV